MKIGIVYSLSQGTCRRVIKADDLNPHMNVAAGEGFLELSEEEYNTAEQFNGAASKARLNALVKKYTGIETGTDRHIIVQGDEVVGLLLGDPAIDGEDWKRRYPGRLIEPHGSAKVGYRKGHNSDFAPVEVAE